MNIYRISWFLLSPSFGLYIRHCCTILPLWKEMIGHVIGVMNSLNTFSAVWFWYKTQIDSSPRILRNLCQQCTEVHAKSNVNGRNTMIHNNCLLFDTAIIENLPQRDRSYLWTSLAHKEQLINEIQYCIRHVFRIQIFWWFLTRYGNSRWLNI